MASVIQRSAVSPKQAVRRRARFDRLLDPEVLKALSEPTRARLLSCLLKCGRPCSVTAVAACCSLDFSMVARHLVTLAKSGLLESERKGRTVHYRADGPALSGWFRELALGVDELSVPGASRCRGGFGSNGTGCGEAGCGCRGVAAVDEIEQVDEIEH